MGCINIKGDNIKSCIKINAYKINNDFNLIANRVGTGIKISCGLVCSVKKANYLRISPDYIFLMPGNDFQNDVLVTSNVIWNVK